jgi:hypothetical protein
MRTSLVKNLPESECSKCGGPVTERPAHPYPVALTAVFGLSFVAFLFFSQHPVVRQHRPIVYAWTAAQATLGLLLIRARLRARKRVSRCIRCDAALPS